MRPGDREMMNVHLNFWRDIILLYHNIKFNVFISNNLKWQKRGIPEVNDIIYDFDFLHNGNQTRKLQWARQIRRIICIHFSDNISTYIITSYWLHLEMSETWFHLLLRYNIATGKTHIVGGSVKGIESTA